MEEMFSDEVFKEADSMSEEKEKYIKENTDKELDKLKNKDTVYYVPDYDSIFSKEYDRLKLAQLQLEIKQLKESK